MFIDQELLLSEDQVLATGETDSTNVIDLTTDRDIGRGEPVAMFISVGAAAFVGGTYTFALESDDNAAMTSSTIVATATVADTDLTEGARVVVPLGITNERYLQGVYTLGGTTPAVTITTSIQPMCAIATEDVVYPSGYVIA